MALITKAIRGTQDVLPNESHEWQYVELRQQAAGRAARVSRKIGRV